MSSLSTLPKGDSAWLLRKSIQRIMQQVSVLETNIGSSTTGNSANTQVIFNDAGTLRGDAGLTYNKATDTLSTGSATITGDLTVDTSVLKVNSTTNKVGVNTTNLTNDLTVQTSTAKGGIHLNFSGSTFGLIGLVDPGVTSNNTIIGSVSNNSLELMTNNSTKATIDSSGNVGIGVTPSAWSTYKGLQVGYASLAGYAGADTLLGSNVYFDGGAFRYIAAGLASSYRQLAGGHQWSTAVAGVNPGDILTPLPLATLDASGNFSPTGNVVMANTKGIDFSATASGSGTMTSELLNDYEEGTWVGTLKGATTDPTIAVTATGRYTKVGRLVSVQISFSNVNTTGASGDAYIIGLPFANSSITVHGSAASYLALTFSGYLGSEADPGGTNISLFDIRSGNVWASAQHSAGTSRYINAELTYTVA